MSVKIYDFALNGLTPGALDPATGAVAAYYPLLPAVTKSRVIDANAVRLTGATFLISWAKATAAGVLNVQLGMYGCTSFVTVATVNAATSFYSSTDDAIGIAIDTQSYELVRFDGSLVTGGSPFIIMG